MTNKFHLRCNVCGYKINNFKEWFNYGQKCPKCDALVADVVYNQGYKPLSSLLRNNNFKPQSIWDYFDYMPLYDKQNIISTGGEGIVPIDNWQFLEKFAKEYYNINIKVYAHRHDQNSATGTFKDLAGTVVASVLKENNIQNYVGASTGNIGVAYSRYLAAAGITLYLFIPDISLKLQEAEISSYGQNVFRVEGDYHAAKRMAKEFAMKHKFILTGGNFDPMRIEAKKTMVYEWLRLLPHFPTVFMQAISGGSGPIGVAKACNELEGFGLFEKLPRFVLPQPDRCAPMAEAWIKAKSENFPSGWEYDYPVYENPKTRINTLSTGNPTAYPVLSKIVKNSDGDILSSPEDLAINASRLIAYYSAFKPGPAAAITVVGFFQALREKKIKDGDVVMLNIGEGTVRSPEFVEEISYTSKNTKTIADCQLYDRKGYEKELWDGVLKI